VTDGLDGILVPPADREALAAALGRVLDDHDLGSRLGAAARETVRARFSVERMVASVMAQYEVVAPSARRTFGRTP